MPDTLQLSLYYTKLERDTYALAELLGIKDFVVCKSPYAGVEIWWGFSVLDNKYKHMLTYVGDFAYSNVGDLPGAWTWQGDYWFLDLN